MSDIKKFCKWILEQSFEGGDIHGDDAQDKALELGLLRKEPFDPDVHIDIIEFIELEKGDDVYLYTDKLEKGGDK